MNLITAFPEIDLFFRKKQFTDDDLLVFVNELEKKYQDAKLRQTIASLIKLKILQFEIISCRENNQPFQKVITSSKKVKSKKEGAKNHSNIELLKTKTLPEIALILEWSLFKLRTLLAQKKIYTGDNQFLLEDEFKSVKEMFNSRLVALDRLHKMHHPIKIVNNKNKQKSLDRSIGVYKKIEAIGLGKLIYIRKQ